MCIIPEKGRFVNRNFLAFPHFLAPRKVPEMVCPGEFFKVAQKMQKLKELKVYI